MWHGLLSLLGMEGATKLLAAKATPIYSPQIVEFGRRLLQERTDADWTLFVHGWAREEICYGLDVLLIFARQSSAGHERFENVLLVPISLLPPRPLLAEGTIVGPILRYRSQGCASLQDSIGRHSVGRVLSELDWWSDRLAMEPTSTGEQTSAPKGSLISQAEMANCYRGDLLLSCCEELEFRGRIYMSGESKKEPDIEKLADDMRWKLLLNKLTPGEIPRADRKTTRTQVIFGRDAAVPKVKNLLFDMPFIGLNEYMVAQRAVRERAKELKRKGYGKAA